MGSKTAFFSILLVISLLFFVLFNLGKYLDVSMKPEKTDIIVSLNKGIARVNKSLCLIRQGYSKKNILVLTYNRKTHNDYIVKKMPELKLIIDSSPYNTAEEIKFIKKYMVKNHYQSAAIVSDPPHTRRIEILTKLIRIKGDENIKFIILGSKVPWWEKEKYYKDKRSFRFAITEMIKIPYTVFWYGFIEKFGIVWEISVYQKIKRVTLN